MDWFERLTGFAEETYDETKAKLEVVDQNLKSLVNKSSYAIGSFELVSLRELREQAVAARPKTGRPKVRNITGDARRLHRSQEYAGALFQVASQFNCLEMTSPGITPEHGVTRYENDRTQGPACAIAAGAATIYRNYFVHVGRHSGQTSRVQLDGLADVGSAFAEQFGRPVDSLWQMSNGYALCTETGLGGIGMYLHASTDHAIDELRGLLRIGIHRDVQVTDGEPTSGQLVSQAFCSALPVAYSSISNIKWQPFATLVLQAAYEATLWAAVMNAQRGSSNIVLLTRLGGGAFGNADTWIDDAIRHALAKVEDYALEVRLVSYGDPMQSMLDIANEFR
jgi:hypothetical protein